MLLQQLPADRGASNAADSDVVVVPREAGRGAAVEERCDALLECAGDLVRVGVYACAFEEHLFLVALDEGSLPVGDALDVGAVARARGGAGGEDEAESGIEREEDGDCCKRAAASGARRFGRRPYSAASSAMKCSASIGMSCCRSRKAGTKIGMTFNRK